MSETHDPAHAAVRAAAFQHGGADSGGDGRDGQKRPALARMIAGVGPGVVRISTRGLAVLLGRSFVKKPSMLGFPSILIRFRLP